MALFAIFLICLVSAAICSNIAERKGHNTALWGFLGFFLGPFAILFIAIAAADEQAPAEVRTGMKQCYACAEPVRVEANICRYCGAKFDPIETARLTETRKVRYTFSEAEEAEYKKMLFRNGCIVIVVIFAALLFVLSV